MQLETFTKGDKMKKWYVLFLMLPLLMFVACDDDDNGDNDPTPYEGANYDVSMDYTISPAKDGDSIVVIVTLLNPDAVDPDESRILIDGVPLELVDFTDSIASFSTIEIILIEEEEYTFDFSCGEDSVSTVIVTPPPVTINITSPTYTDDSIYYPVFDEGAEIPIIWEYDGTAPSHVFVSFDGFNNPNFFEHEASLLGTETSYTIPAGFTNGLGGHGSFPMPTIFVCPQSSIVEDGDEIELDLSVLGMPAIQFVRIEDTDTSGGLPDSPVVTLSGDALIPVFNWSPDLGAMSMGMWRNTTNHGQPASGMIWQFGSIDPEIGFNSGVTFGIVPPECYELHPVSEDIIAGETYSVLITFWISDGVGITSTFSFNT